MNTLVVFQSKTGFTKQYAQWIAEDLSCALKPISDVKASEIAQYDLVIYGGFIMAGMVHGLDKMKAYHPQKMIVFGVGSKSQEEAPIQQMAEMNKLADIPFYYYEGGMRPEKMGWMGRTIIKLATKKAPVYADHTNRDAIAELVQSVNSLTMH